MNLIAGARLGPYEIVAPLGAGGMGEVYKARDTRLDRTVAVKILPAEVATDPQRRERFRREARAISSLTHPHICTLHDIGEQDGVDFLVMEYLLGETLAHRLLRGALPLEDVLRIAIQLADALDAAHRAGLTHRDLKPANVMLTASGAKVLDFGLAKWHGSDQDSMIAAAQARADPTLTQVGSVVGTMQYMAPEQVEGKTADARSDLFALGAMIYEMTTGRKAFEGKSASGVMAAILTSDSPPMSMDRPMIPAALERTVRKCLAKDASRRWHTASDLRDEFRWIEETLSTQPTAPSGRSQPEVVHRRQQLGWIVGAMLVAAAAVLVFGRLVRPAQVNDRVTKLALLPPEHTVFDTVVVSPSGQQIAFTASDASGRTQIWIRPLDALTASPLPGTVDASFPFWSPDGRSIAFVADGKLKMIEAAGGQPRTISDAPASTSRGGAWGNGTIILVPRANDSLFRTTLGREDKLERLTHLDPTQQETSHRWPSFLPDGHHFLYTVRSAQPTVSGIYVADLFSNGRKRLLPDVTNAVYVPAASGSGHLLFARGRAVMAQPFDAARLQLAGNAEMLANNVAFAPAFSWAAYSASQTGVLVFTSVLPNEDTEFTWFDRSGKSLRIVHPPGSCNRPALAPDDRSLAFDCIDPQSGQRDVWVVDLVRGISSLLALGAMAVWSPDSRKLAFATRDVSPTDIVERQANGSDEQITLIKNATGFPSALSPDERWLLIRNPLDLFLQPISHNNAGQGFILHRLTTESGANSSLRIQGGFTGMHAMAVFSPDGHWIAYESDESGRSEVFVERFAGDAAHRTRSERWQVSNSGGVDPQWRGDGRELFYLSPMEGQVRAVAINHVAATLKPQAPISLFSVRLSRLLVIGFNVTRDGQRFLVEVASSAPERSPATVILNWPASLKKPQ